MLDKEDYDMKLRSWKSGKKKMPYKHSGTYKASLQR